MQAIRQAVSALWSAAGWLNDAGSRCDGIPLIGPAVGHPLHTTAGYVRTASSNLASFDSWVDGVAAMASSARQRAQDAYNYAAGTVLSIAQDARQRAQDAYNYASGHLQGLIAEARQKAQDAYDYAAGAVWQAAQDAWKKAQDAYDYAAGYLQDRITEFRQALDHGLAQLNGWISDQLRALRQGLDQFRADLDDQAKRIPTGLDIIGWVEDSLGYLATQAIALMTREAASFAGALWSLLEAVLKNIKVPER